ncbi:A/G-specific adenine glycosylase [Halorientalis halophila]|uniref:A/G-specific adenine glycosylase n=1 Tax=Halorientalis halophila TaxID=3108499 RepID=UPI003008AB7B
MPASRRDGLQEQLLEWYEANGRHDLPWREERRSAFEVLIAEVLLQRTTATAVAGAYVPVVSRYPSPEAVVAAPSGEIRDRIAPLGLSKRAAYLERISGQLLDRHSGRVPRDRSDLSRLHGVGEYTARSVSVHSHGEPVAAVDTNVERLLSRFYGIDSDESDVQGLADDLTPPGRSSDSLHAMLDFAAAVCTARSPNCAECPVEARCDSPKGEDGPN